MGLLSERKFINTLLVFALIILFGIGIGVYVQSNRMLNASNWVFHTHDVIDTANQIQILETKAETGVATLLLTNRDKISDKLASLESSSNANLNRISYLTRDNLRQIPRIKQLRALINEKYVYLQQAIQLYKNNNKNAAFALFSDQKMDQLNEQTGIVIQNIISDELRLLQIRNASYGHEIAHSNIDNVYSIGVCLILLLFAFALINYHLSQRYRVEKSIQDAELKLREANRNLQLSAERFNLAVTGGRIGLWDWEVGTNNVFYSPYLKNMLGYSTAEFPDTYEAFMSRVHPDDITRLKNAIADHLKNHGPYDIEYRVIKKSGIYHWYEATGQALWDESGHPTRMVGALFDIAERKRFVKRLHIQFEITKILAEGSNLEDIAPHIVRTICDNLDYDFGALWMKEENKDELRCASSWQRSEQTQAFNDITHNMVFEKGVGLPGRVYAKGKAAWIEDIMHDANFPRFNHAKTSGLHSAFCFPIFLRNKVIGVVEFISTDIKLFDEELLQLMNTVGLQMGLFLLRKEAENQLRLSESYKQAILESASDCIITIDSQGKIISCNSQTRQVFNYTNVAIKEIDINKLIPHLSAAVALLADKELHELKGKRKNGEEFPIEATISKMENKNELRYVIIVRDITERKKIEVMKNEFISVVSHELRTPLTSIRGSLVLLSGGKMGHFTDKAYKLLGIANKNCDRLLLLINDILDIEKIEAGKMQFKFRSVEINQLVNEAISNNHIYAEKYNVSIKLNDPRPEIYVRADPDRLMQVLTNLISNAVKFSNPGGVIELSIKSIHHDVRVEVKDHGAGIPIDFQSRIFQKFSQADSSNTRVKGGSGLGLNISKAIIEKHYGSMSFHSAPGRGATFYFDLPMEGVTNVTTAAPGQMGEATPVKLLICEDDEDQASYLKTLLESENIQTDIAYNVMEAKKLLEENIYYALLLDLILPDEDGITFIRELRQNDKTKNLPIVVLSVIAQTGRNLLNGYAFSVVDWLDKPLNINRLLSAINRIQVHKNKPHILHVEDNSDIQSLVSTLLENEAIIAAATSINEATKLIQKEKFDLAILDLHLPDGNGTDLLNLLSQYNIPILVYSNYALDREYSARVKQALMKSTTSNEKLLQTIKNLLPETIKDIDYV